MICVPSGHHLDSQNLEPDQPLPPSFSVPCGFLHTTFNHNKRKKRNRNLFLHNYGIIKQCILELSGRKWWGPGEIKSWALQPFIPQCPCGLIVAWGASVWNFIVVYYYLYYGLFSSVPMQLSYKTFKGKSHVNSITSNRVSYSVSNIPEILSFRDTMMSLIAQCIPISRDSKMLF